MTDPDFHLPTGTERPRTAVYLAIPAALSVVLAVAVWPATLLIAVTVAAVATGARLWKDSK